MNSITDKPIAKLDEDLLKVKAYANALHNFIINSDTPITIGLQGEWGTGKTSLMGIIREQLIASTIATSWVNTWEYSMFRSANETTPAVLQGMLDKLEEKCKDEGNWDIGDEASKKIKAVGRFLGNVANQAVANKTGVNVQGAASDGGGVIQSQISSVKKDIGELIERLISSSGNPYQKVVFFIDDLDRIPPSDAVEVLEALKNVFDIPQCVFILAIDYDVVVKGLESKFGKKTPENEREFRSFFDKIIQVPFSMPIGAYGIEDLLYNKLKAMGFEVSIEEAESFAKVVRYTVGTNPRSLKRYLNSFSLIDQVRRASTEAEEEGEEASNFMLFSLLGIQISFPQIFRELTMNPNFDEWDESFASKRSLNLSEIQEKLRVYGDNENLDEAWEQIVWGFCQRDPYLKSKVFDALLLLNHLRNTFSDNLHDEIEKALQFATITSVDDDASAKQASSQVGKRIRFEGIDAKIDQLNEIGCNEDAINAFACLMRPLYEKSETENKFRLNFAKTGNTFSDSSLPRGEQLFLYVVNPQKRSVGLNFSITYYSGLIDECEAFVKNLYSGIDISEHCFRNTYRKQPEALRFKHTLANVDLAKYLEILCFISSKLVAKS